MQKFIFAIEKKVLLPRLYPMNWKIENIFVLHVNQSIQIIFFFFMLKISNNCQHLGNFMNCICNWKFRRKQIQNYCINIIAVSQHFTSVKFLGSTRYTFAYQAKLGVNYLLTTQVETFAGLRYFGIHSNKFESIIPRSRYQWVKNIILLMKLHALSSLLQLLHSKLTYIWLQVWVNLSFMILNSWYDWTRIC